METMISSLVSRYERGALTRRGLIQGLAMLAAAVGAWFLWRAAAFLRPGGRDAAARRLFHFSLAYLPLLLGALVVDRLLEFHP